jgi:hypothetical protein
MSNPLSRALQNKSVERPRVYKGFYVYADQYAVILELAAKNKATGKGPTSASDMVREALDTTIKKYSK